MSVDGPVESASVCETSSTWTLAGRPGIKPSLRAIKRDDFPDPFLVPETEGQPHYNVAGRAGAVWKARTDRAKRTGRQPSA